MQAHIRFHVKDRIVYGFTRRNTRFHQFKVHIVFITVITFSYLHEVFSKRNSRNNAFSWSIVNNKNINLVSCDPDAVFQQIDLLLYQKNWVVAMAVESAQAVLDFLLLCGFRSELWDNGLCNVLYGFGSLFWGYDVHRWDVNEDWIPFHLTETPVVDELAQV